MNIGKIGEFGLIDEIKKKVKTGKGVVKGIGDDCAVVKFSRDKYMLLTCDMLVEGVDFLKDDSPYLIGAKSIAVSISDIAANGGWPSYALISLGLTKNTPLSYVQEVYRGMNLWTEKYGIDIVGGDISRAAKITLNVSLVGFVERKRLVLRSAARIGDIIFVTGRIGAALIDKRRLHIKPRADEARYLASNYRVNAMIDISDGLPQDLHHICKESGVGAVIYQELVPLYKKGSGFIHTLSLGEDYELLFTMPVSDAKRLVSSGIKTYQPIGEITPKRYGVRLLDERRRERPLRRCGFRHF